MTFLNRLRLFYFIASASFMYSCVKAPSLKEVTISAPVTAWTWPMYIAKEGGYYEQNGLDVKLVFANHPIGIAMLVSGEAQVNVNSLQQAMQLGPRHDSVRIYGSPVDKWLFALMARNDIVNMRELKGKRIGVAQVGDSTYNYALQLLAKVGLSERDVTMITIGASGRVPALISRRIDATMVSAPAYYALEAQGIRSLANITDYDDLFTPSVLLMEKATVNASPHLPELIIKAHAEAVKRFYADKVFAIECFMKYDKQDRAGVERVYDSYVRSASLKREPYISADAVRYMIENERDASIAHRMKEFDFHSLIDNKTVERLDHDGFFEQVFGPSEREQADRSSQRAFR